MTSRSGPTPVAASRVRRNIALAPRNARLTPASRAAVTDARSGGDQYSSCPSETSALAPSSRCGSAAMSMLVTYASGKLDRAALIDEEERRAVLIEGPVEADRERPVVIVGLAPGPVVQVVATPHVVRLPGRGPILDHHLARGARRPHGHRHVALRSRVRVQPEQIGAAGPVVRRHGQR